MSESKLMKKVSLQQHYKGDKQKDNAFVAAAVPIYREDIGSVCMKDPNAKTFRKVIKRVSKQSKAGVFSIPSMFKKPMKKAMNTRNKRNVTSGISVIW